MPLNDALLTPVEGENPSGANLYYDKLFDQIKEARTEDEDIGSSGAWGRTLKKADHALVIKLATEALTKRTKDLRLVGWLIESHIKREGWPLLPPSLELLKDFQDAFWPTMFPEIDEDGDLGLRTTAVESAINRLAVIVKSLPVTKAGHTAGQYSESRKLGYEEAADTSEKQATREDAIKQGVVTPEEFDAGFNSTTKPSLVAIETALNGTLEKIQELSEFQEEKYGDDYPMVNKLTNAVEEVKLVVATLLYEKRKTDPDPVDEPEPEPELEEEVAVEEQEPAAEEAVVAAPRAAAAPKPKAGGFSGTPTTAEQAWAAILAGATFFQNEAIGSPVAYLVCSGLRFGETRLAGAYPSSDFGVAPPTETRQALRRLANDGNWDDLLREGLKALVEPCGRTWLDLHRYLHRAASSNGYGELAQAIVANVRGMLLDLPDMRTWSLDDDTPVANGETQQWLDSDVVIKVEEPVVEESSSYAEPEPEPEPVYVPPPAASQGDDGPAKPELYEEALALVKAKRPGEGIQMLVRDAELQPSGRSKFQRRVQVAQLCLAANQGTVAYPILQQLAREAEQRNLETWETGKMLAQPLALLLKCLDKRGSSAEEKEALFERLCRLDPEAAFDIRL